LDGLRLVAGLGAAAAAVVMSGHPQTIAYALALVIAYALFRGRPWVDGRWAAMTAAVLLGIGVAAGCWLPAVQLILRSTHGFAGIGPGDPWRINAANLLAFFVPFAQGGSVGLLYGSRAAPYWGISETTAYPGMGVW